ncbi:MAG: hypothetical protein B7Y41_01135 [Hydrogenophilales bacterium 28-61-23]|nr:MAG: hypothetical protein B7Y41_01135 [Hydrogenophilales bacterium 28-61-23]
MHNPGPDKFPNVSFDYAGGHFELTPAGVHYFGRDKEGKKQPARLICSPLHIMAMTRDAQSSSWGLLLEWWDEDGKRHQWAMPLESLEGDSAEVWRRLASEGLKIWPSQGARTLLAAYLKLCPVEARAVCVDRLGWHGGVYVTPEQSIGDCGQLVVLQNQHALEPAFSEAGTPENWRENVAALACGNSRLVLALSIAFAAGLADVAGLESGGFHFRGASSSGKSTALKLAASVWGNPAAYVRLWRSTTNGLEGLAALHNDGILILDEIGQIDSGAAGDAAYLLANGQGKVRASRNGMAKPGQRWRLLFLSAGEETLTAIMERAGKKTSAGQEIRLADIEANAGADMGMFEALNGYPSAADLTTAIQNATLRHYGSVGMRWLQHIVADRTLLAEPLREEMHQFVASVLPKVAAGQAQRVAYRFGLAAAAGELATRYGLTGWPVGEAIQAAKTCFNAWLANFGEGNREERAIVTQARAFIEQDGASRFEDMTADHEQRIPNRAGYFRTREDGSREFLVLPEAFKSEICQGYDDKTVKQALTAAGMLVRAKDGKPTQVFRLPGLSTTARAYVLRYIGEHT